MEIIQKHSFKPFIKQSCNFIALRKGFFETVWKLEALERLYRSTGLIFLQWRKEVFNNYHSIPAF